MAEDGDEVFMTRSFNITPTTTEQHLIVHSGKSEAKVSNIEECARGIVLLKLTTDRHEALCGLFASAELLVCFVHCFLFLFICGKIGRSMDAAVNR